MGSIVPCGFRGQCPYARLVSSRTLGLTSSPVPPHCGLPCLCSSVRVFVVCQVPGLVLLWLVLCPPLRFFLDPLLCSLLPLLSSRGRLPEGRPPFATTIFKIIFIIFFVIFSKSHVCCRRDPLDRAKTRIQPFILDKELVGSAGRCASCCGVGGGRRASQACSRAVC